MYTVVNPSNIFSYDDPLHEQHPSELNNCTSTYFQKKEPIIYIPQEESK